MSSFNAGRFPILGQTDPTVEQMPPDVPELDQPLKASPFVHLGVEPEVGVENPEQSTSGFEDFGRSTGQFFTNTLPGAITDTALAVYESVVGTGLDLVGELLYGKTPDEMAADLEARAAAELDPLKAAKMRSAAQDIRQSTAAMQAKPFRSAVQDTGSGYGSALTGESGFGGQPMPMTREEFAQTMYDPEGWGAYLGGIVPSVGMSALGIAVPSLMPAVLASFGAIGFSAGRQAYVDQMTMAGLEADPDVADMVGVASGIIELVSERIGLDGLSASARRAVINELAEAAVSGQVRTAAKSVARVLSLAAPGVAIESIEEAVAQIGQNASVLLGEMYSSGQVPDAREAAARILDGVPESMLGGAIAGGVLTTGVSSVAVPQLEREVYRRAAKSRIERDNLGDFKSLSLVSDEAVADAAMGGNAYDFTVGGSEMSRKEAAAEASRRGLTLSVNDLATPEALQRAVLDDKKGPMARAAQHRLIALMNAGMEGDTLSLSRSDVRSMTGESNAGEFNSRAARRRLAGDLIGRVDVPGPSQEVETAAKRAEGPSDDDRLVSMLEAGIDARNVGKDGKLAPGASKARLRAVPRAELSDGDLQVEADARKRGLRVVWFSGTSGGIRLGGAQLGERGVVYLRKTGKTADRNALRDAYLGILTHEASHEAELTESGQKDVKTLLEAAIPNFSSMSFGEKLMWAAERGYDTDLLNEENIDSEIAAVLQENAETLRSSGALSLLTSDRTRFGRTLDWVRRGLTSLGFNGKEASAVLRHLKKSAENPAAAIADEVGEQPEIDREAEMRLEARLSAGKKRKGRFGNFKSSLFEALYDSEQRVMRIDEFNALLSKAAVKKDEIYWTGLEDYLKDLKTVDLDKVIKAIKPVVVDSMVSMDTSDAQERMIEDVMADYAVVDIGGDVWKIQESSPRRGVLWRTISDMDDEYGSESEAREALEGYAREYVEELTDYDDPNVQYQEYIIPGPWTKYFEYTSTLKKTKSPTPKFEAPHFDAIGRSENLIVHARATERPMLAADGETRLGNTLFVEEIQSDWHQTGRTDGYAGAELLEDLKDPSRYSMKIKKGVLGYKKSFEWSELLGNAYRHINTDRDFGYAIDYRKFKDGLGAFNAHDGSSGPVAYLMLPVIDGVKDPRDPENTVNIFIEARSSISSDGQKSVSFRVFDGRGKDIVGYEDFDLLNSADKEGIYTRILGTQGGGLDLLRSDIPTSSAERAREASQALVEVVYNLLHLVEVYGTDDYSMSFTDRHGRETTRSYRVTRFSEGNVGRLDGIFDDASDPVVPGEREFRKIIDGGDDYLVPTTPREAVSNPPSARQNLVIRVAGYLYGLIKGEVVERAVPDAPFSDTRAWVSLSLKNIIAHAVRDGYKTVTLVDGLEVSKQNQRDIRGTFSNVRVEVSSRDSSGAPVGFNVFGTRLSMSGETVADNLEQLAAGIDASRVREMITDPQGLRTDEINRYITMLENGDMSGISVPGAINMSMPSGGYSHHYDKIVRSEAIRIAKRFGGRVDTRTVNVGPNRKFLTIIIGDDMAESVRKGMPLFSASRREFNQAIVDRFSDSYPQTGVIDGATGFLLDDGTPVTMGMDGSRGDDHRAIVGSAKELRALGVSSSAAREAERGSRTAAMRELMSIGSMVRMFVSGSARNGFVLGVELASGQSITPEQRRALRDFVAGNRVSTMYVDQELGDGSISSNEVDGPNEDDVSNMLRLSAGKGLPALLRRHRGQFVDLRLPQMSAPRFAEMARRNGSGVSALELSRKSVSIAILDGFDAGYAWTVDADGNVSAFGMNAKSASDPLVVETLVLHAVTRGKGTVVLSGHIGQTELQFALGAMGIPLTFNYERMTFDATLSEIFDDDVRDAIAERGLAGWLDHAERLRDAAARVAGPVLPPGEGADGGRAALARVPAAAREDAGAARVGDIGARPVVRPGLRAIGREEAEVARAPQSAAQAAIRLDRTKMLIAPGSEEHGLIEAFTRARVAHSAAVQAVERIEKSQGKAHLRKARNAAERARKAVIDAGNALRIAQEPRFQELGIPWMPPAVGVKIPIDDLFPGVVESSVQVIATALNRYATGILGSVARSEAVAKNLVVLAMARELESGVARGGTAVDWYETLIDRTKAVWRRAYPKELGGRNAKSREHMEVLMTIMAITSNGERVVNNAMHTRRVWDGFLRTGLLEVPDGVQFQREDAVIAGFRLFNDMRAKLGHRDTMRRLRIRGTDRKEMLGNVAELRSALGLDPKKLKYDPSIPDGFEMQQSQLFGPKIGAFWANLDGNFDILTADLWFTRTMMYYAASLTTPENEVIASRMRELKEIADGNVVSKRLLQSKNEEKQVVQIQPESVLQAAQLLGFDESVVADPISFMSWVQGSYATFSKKGPSGKTFRETNFPQFVGKPEGVRLAARQILHGLKTIAEGDPTINEIPENADERAIMASTVKKAVAILERKGTVVKVSAAQAVLWYFEKDVYYAFNAGEIGEGQDFVTASRLALKDRLAMGRDQLMLESSPVMGESSAPIASFSASPVWRNALVDRLASMQETATPEQVKAHIAKDARAAAQADWIEIERFLAGKTKVSRSALSEWVAANDVLVQEKMLLMGDAPARNLVFGPATDEEVSNIAAMMISEKKFDSLVDRALASDESHPAHMDVSLTHVDRSSGQIGAMTFSNVFFRRRGDLGVVDQRHPDLRSPPDLEAVACQVHMTVTVFQPGSVEIAVDPENAGSPVALIANRTVFDHMLLLDLGEYLRVDGDGYELRDGVTRKGLARVIGTIHDYAYAKMMESVYPDMVESIRGVLGDKKIPTTRAPNELFNPTDFMHAVQRQMGSNFVDAVFDLTPGASHMRGVQALNREEARVAARSQIPRDYASLPVAPLYPSYSLADSEENGGRYGEVILHVPDGYDALPRESNLLSIRMENLAYESDATMSVAAMDLVAGSMVGNRGAFRDPHWSRLEGVGRVFAHGRFSTVQNSDGDPIMFVEEVQSDFHQMMDSTKHPSTANVVEYKYLNGLLIGPDGEPAELQPRIKASNGLVVEKILYLPHDQTSLAYAPGDPDGIKVMFGSDRQSVQPGGQPVRGNVDHLRNISSDFSMMTDSRGGRWNDLPTASVIVRNGSGYQRVRISLLDLMHSEITFELSNEDRGHIRFTSRNLPSHPRQQAPWSSVIYGLSPLKVAEIDSKIDIVRTLLQHNATINAYTDGIDHMKRNRKERFSYTTTPLPFEKRWPQLVVERMLQIAAQNDYHQLAISSAALQTERWGSEYIGWAPVDDINALDERIKEGLRLANLPSSVSEQQFTTGSRLQVLFVESQLPNQYDENPYFARNALGLAELASFTHGATSDGVRRKMSILESIPGPRGGYRLWRLHGQRVLYWQYTEVSGGLRLDEKMSASEARVALQRLLTPVLQTSTNRRIIDIASQIVDSVDAPVREPGFVAPRAQGMQQFYDRKLLADLRKFLRRYGAEIGRDQIEAYSNSQIYDVSVIEMTDELKAAVLGGITKFSASRMGVSWPKESADIAAMAVLDNAAYATDAIRRDTGFSSTKLVDDAEDFVGGAITLDQLQASVEQYAIGAYGRGRGPSAVSSMQAAVRSVLAPASAMHGISKGARFSAGRRSMPGEFWFTDSGVLDADDTPHELWALDLMVSDVSRILSAVGSPAAQEIASRIESNHDKDMMSFGEDSRLSAIGSMLSTRQDDSSTPDWQSVFSDALDRIAEQPSSSQAVEDSRQLRVARDVLLDRVDARDYALQRGWIRVHQNHVQVLTLDRSTVERLANGVYEVMSEGAREQEFTIEVSASRRMFRNVPYSALDTNDPAAIAPYRSERFSASMRMDSMAASRYAKFAAGRPMAKGMKQMIGRVALEVNKGKISPEDGVALMTIMRMVGESALKNTRLSIKKGQPGQLGSYHSLLDVVTLTRSTIANGTATRTFVHELWHAVTRFIDPDTLEALRRDYLAEVEEFIRIHGFNPRGATIDPGVDELAIRKGIDLTEPRYYRLITLDEYIAVTMTDRTLERIDRMSAESRGVIAMMRDLSSQMLRWMRSFMPGNSDMIYDELVDKFMSGQIGESWTYASLAELAAFTPPTRANQRLLEAQQGFPIAQEIEVVTSPLEDMYDRFKRLRFSASSVGELNRVLAQSGMAMRSIPWSELTDAQREYFKDTKMRDDEGNLLVFYHGTNAVFEMFDPSMLREGRAGMMYFASNPERANEWADYHDGTVYIVHLLVTKPFDPENPDHWREIGEYASAVSARMGNRQFDEVTGTTVHRSFTWWANLENDELVSKIRQAGFDGIWVREQDNEGRDRRDMAVFKSNQIKSVFNLDPTSDPRMNASAGIRFRNTRTNIIRTRGQDAYVMLEKALDDFEAAHGALPPSLNPLLAIRRMPAAVGIRQRDFRTGRVNPILRRMKESRISMRYMGEYLFALHAAERNAYVRSVNPGATEMGSGMTDQRAREIIGAVDARPDAAKWREIAAAWQEIARESLDTQLAAGLITDADYANITSRYKNYVPMMDVPEGSGPPLESEVKRFSLGKRQLRQTTGRGEEAATEEQFAGVIVHIVGQREMVMSRAYRNIVANRFLNISRYRSEPGLWQIIEEPTRRQVNLNTGVVEEVPDTTWRDDPQVMEVLVIKPFMRTVVETRDGVATTVEREYGRGSRVLVRIGDPEIGKVLTRGKLPPEHWAMTALRVAKMWTNWVRLMATSAFNPDFLLSNPARDVQTALATVFDEESKRKEIMLDMAKGYPASFKAVLNGVFGRPIANEELAKMWAQFERLGGRQTMFVPQEFDERYRDLLSEMSDPSRIQLTGRFAKTAIVDVWDNFNSTFDNAIRFAFFVSAVRAGMDPEVAAVKARNLTVDFSKRGSETGQLMTMYAFANAGLQGTAKFARLMKSRRGQRVVGSLFVIGFLNAMLQDMFDGEDEDRNGIADFRQIEEYKHEGNLIVPTGMGWSAKIPLSYGINIPYVLGRKMWQALSGKKSVSVAASEAARSMLATFNPFGGEGVADGGHGFVRALAPDILDIPIDVMLNKDYRGNDLYKVSPYETDPVLSETGSRRAPESIKAFARLLNSATGGDYATSGFVDIPPDAAWYVMLQMTGGTGRAVERIGRTVSNLIQGSVEVSEIPGIRRFVDDFPTEQQNASAYYDIRTRTAAVEARIDRYETDREKHEAVKQSEFTEIQLAMMRSAEKKLRDLRKRVRLMREAGVPQAETDRLEAELNTVMAEAVRNIRSASR